MTDTVDLGAKLAYQNRVERLFERYGEKSWGLLYQADVGARLEEIPRIKLELSQNHAEALAAGKTTSFDPKRPWNASFKEMADRDKFWNAEFTEPALWWCLRVSNH